MRGRRSRRPGRIGRNNICSGEVAKRAQPGARTLVVKRQAGKRRADITSGRVTRRRTMVVVIVGMVMVIVTVVIVRVGTLRTCQLCGCLRSFKMGQRMQQRSLHRHQQQCSKQQAQAQPPQGGALNDARKERYCATASVSR